MRKKFRIWFSQLNDDGIREFRYYYTSNFDAAILALRVAIDELELIKKIYPNMCGISEWNEQEADWLEWGWENNKDIWDELFKLDINEGE